MSDTVTQVASAPSSTGSSATIGATRNPDQQPSSPTSDTPLMQDPSKTDGASTSQRRYVVGYQQKPAYEPDLSSIARFRRALGLYRSSDTGSYGVEESIPSITDYPQGYPYVAAWQDLHPSFHILRKFGWLRKHVLLDLQDELQELEEELEEHDKRKDLERLTCRRTDYDKPRSRQDLIRKIRSKLDEYDDLLLRTRKIQAMKRPTRHYQNALWNVIHTEQHIQQSEEDWICRSEDLASVAVDAESGWLNEAIEKGLQMLSPKLLMSLFRNHEDEIRSDDQYGLQLVSAKRIDNLVRGVLTVLACVLLLVPILILFNLQPNTQSEAQRKGYWQVLVIFFSILIFSLCCSICTQARRQEVFSATAAYAAVLVIFLGNTSGSYIIPKD